MIELIIKIKDDESTYTEKHLVYQDKIELSIADPTIHELLSQAKKSISKPLNDPEITIKAIFQL